MENLLNKIEKSENDNPLLTAALKEIETMKEKIDAFRMIIFNDMAHYNDDENTIEEVLAEQQSEYKLNALQALFINN